MGRRLSASELCHSSSTGVVESAVIAGGHEMATMNGHHFSTTAGLSIINPPRSSSIWAIGGG
jgi:hypothetical protein